jgi:hypothetical protein
VRKLLADFSRRFRVLPLGEHAALLAKRSGLPTRKAIVTERPVPRNENVSPLRSEPVFTVEAGRQ